MPRQWKNLTETLKTSNEEVVEMSFDQVSEVVGDLPTEKMHKPGWWEGDPGLPRTGSWSNAGYSVQEVDETKEVVRFKRS